MPKNIEDIIPSGRKSIRSIPIPVRRAKPSELAAEPEPVRRAEPEPARERRRRSPKTRIWVAGLVLVIVAALGILSLQRGATLAYSPRTEALSFSNNTYTAYQAPKSGELGYSVIKLSGEKSMTVPATGEESVSVPAQGRVVIYNEQSSAQSLVKTTRLESPDGKIYRIQEDVSIPAKGSLEVTAVADQPGPSYNIPLSDFTIPGLKGSARYELVYGRSKTPMTGGFTGTRKKVSDSDLSGARSTLESTLRSELLTQARAQMPADFILFPGLAEISYEFLPAEDAGGNNAKVTLRGDLSAAILKRSELSEHVAENRLGSAKIDNPIELTDISALTASLPAGSASSVGTESLKFTLSGSASARYVTDEAALAQSLAGTPKDSLDSVLADFPSIKTASASVRPFWKSVFPEDPSLIKIEEQQ